MARTTRKQDSVSRPDKKVSDNKQGGTVVEGRKLVGAKSGATRQGTTDPNGLGQSTATRQAAKDLGVSDETVRNRVRNSFKLAARNGVVIDKPTPEAMKAEDMIRVGKEALKVAEVDREEAKKTKKAPGRVNPMQPLSKTKTTVRLDVVDL